MTAPAPLRTTFRVTVLGPFEVWREDEALGAASWQRSAQTLLKLLVTSPERRRLREEVIDILWPDASPGGGSSNLRYVLHTLRRALGGADPSPIVSDRTWIGLNGSHSWDIDLARFHELTQRSPGDVAAMEELTELYRGEPLPEDRYEDWATPLRPRIQRTWQDTCRRCAQALREQDQMESALIWLERALEADPLDEETVQQVVKLLNQLGRRTDALKHFRQFERLLKAELDLEPSPETLALAAQAKKPGQAVAEPLGEHVVRPEPTATLETRRQTLSTGAYLGALPSAALVARREELSRVLAVLEGTDEGSRRLVLLAGEPGVGKTRLAQEVTSALHESGFTIAAGRCYQPENWVPYYPFLDILSEILRAAPPTLRETAPERWPYLTRLLPGLAGGPTPVALTRETAGQDEPLLIRSIAGFLEEVARDRPLAILIDDLHWSDSASVKLLSYLAQHCGGSRIFLLGTYREAEISREHPLFGSLIDLRREGVLEKIVLPRLGAESTEKLIAATLGGGSIARDLADIIFRQTEGNPFYIGEVARFMAEAGDLVQRDREWDRRPGSEIQVPDSVRAVVVQRLSRLEAETQDILLAASVLGQTFHFEELRQVSGYSERQVESALDETARADLVREVQPDIFTFSHALAQQAAYGEIPGRKRRRIHLRAAETVAALPGRERRAAEIALHFRQAGHLDGAVQYAILAGDSARRLFAHSEAERHFRLAADLSREIENIGLEAAALDSLAETLFTQGRYVDAGGAAEQSSALFRRVDDFDGEMRAVRRVALALRARGHSREAVGHIHSFLDSRKRLPQSSEHARLRLEAGNLELELGEYEQGLMSFDHSLEIARAVADENLLREIYYRRGAVLWVQGRTEEVLESFDKYAAILEHSDDPWLRLELLQGLGIILQHRGELRASKEYRERYLELAQRIGDPARIANALSQLGASLFLLGDWAEARAKMEAALRLARSIEYVEATQTGLNDLGHLSVSEGDWHSGEQYLLEALSLVAQSENQVSSQYVHLYVANLDLQRGRSRDVIRRLAPVIDRTGYEETLATILLPPLAQAHLDLGEVDRADAIAADALRRTARQSNTIDYCAALIVQSSVREAQGRFDEARTNLDEALRVTREISFLAAEGLALFHRGRLEGQCGDADSARSFLERARDIFSTLGARKDLERAEAALAALAP